MTEIVVADTCSLLNFAVVHRLDLLHGVYGDGIRCAEATRQEVHEQGLIAPELLDVLRTPWLDDPIVFDDPADIAAVERLRRTALGGRSRQPRQHLGEAQSLHAMRTLPALAGAALLTDDTAALDYARRLRLAAVDSADVMSEAYDRHLIGCPDAYELLLRMRDAERGVRIPSTHLLVCP